MSEAVAGARYVVGFMFDDNEEFVLLINKTRPDWQVGKLNGVGGRIEEGESALEAMRREFIEEVGIKHDDWKHFCVLSDARKWSILFFFAHGPIWEAKQMTDEVPLSALVRRLPAHCVSNLHWLIPMALSMKRESISGFSIKEIMPKVQDREAMKR